MSKRSLRVYFATHNDGRLTGHLVRRWSWFLDKPPPAAYGATEEGVMAELAGQLQERLVRKEETLERYLWEETFGVRTVALSLHPMTLVKKQPVIGARELPVRLSYAWCKTESGAFRVMLPRFDWWMVLESLDTARSALTHAVAGALLGANPAWLYDFRREGKEYVKAWSPDVLKSESAKPDKDDDDSERPTVRAVADDLVKRAAAGKLPRPVGEPRVAQRALQLMRSWPRTSILIVGGPGVGKTTEIWQLARMILRQQRESNADLPKLYATSANRILAGMIYLGMWQERVLKLSEELWQEGDYLYVDRLGPLLRPQSDGASIADLLEPGVRSGAIPIIAECTPAELAQARRRNAAFLEHFQRIWLAEAQPTQLLPLLDAYAGRGQKKLHPRATKRMVQLLEAFRRDRRFPGKAFRFIDALQRDERVGDLLYPKDIEAAFARWTGLPLELISDAHVAGVDVIRGRLEQAVVGQSQACLQAAQGIAPFKAGLNPPDRPLSTMLFVGPTGVGKTELAKEITRYLFGSSERLIRLDMSEYMVPGAAQRLLQVGRGVRSLAEQVRREPLSVVLFDEIEKAHPEVFDLLLGIMGEGRLTDASGRFVDFRMSLIVMTSNLGVRATEALGFSAEVAGADFLRAVRDHFRPEFVGRIDQVVPFRHLAPEDVRRIVDLELAKIAKREGFRRRNIEIDVQGGARDRLAALGYDRQFGARPLRRTLEALVVTPIAVLMASEPDLRDRTLVVGSGEGADIVIRE